MSNGPWVLGPVRYLPGPSYTRSVSLEEPDTGVVGMHHSSQGSGTGSPPQGVGGSVPRHKAGQGSLSTSPAPPVEVSPGKSPAGSLESGPFLRALTTRRRPTAPAGRVSHGGLPGPGRNE